MPGNSETISHEQLLQLETNTKATMVAFFQNMKAAALNQLKKYHEAIATTNKTLEITQEQSQDSWCLKGTALNALGTIENNNDYDLQALECFRRAIALCAPGYVLLEAGLNHATILFKLKRNESAIEECLQLLESKMKNQDDEETIQSIADHIKYDPDIETLLSSIYYSQENYQEAKDHSKSGLEALKRKGSKKSFLVQKLYQIQLSCCLKLQQNSEAEIICRILLKLDPSNVEIFLRHLDLLTILRIPESEKIKSTDQFLNNDSLVIATRIKILHLKLSLLKKNNHISESIKVCDKILNLRKNDKEALITKSSMLILDGDFESANRICEIAIKLSINSNEIIINQALALQGLQKYELAIKFLDTVINHSPEYQLAYFHKANTLMRMENYDEALKNYDIALKFEPNNRQIIRCKTSIYRLKGLIKEAIDLENLFVQTNEKKEKEKETNKVNQN